MAIDDSDAGPVGPVGDKGLFGRGDGEPSIRQIPVAILRENLRRAVGGLRELFDEIAEQPGGMRLRQAQIAFEVMASGGIALVGTSAQLAGKGAITLTFGE
ncbi:MULTISPECIES: hypothetical protein [unclassified Frankia]|uniref:Pepco domain-containing protein n=1 Tax=unclassified Frankia TaxID=2632575 RepID=UPI002AD4740C|nr:MULTISPECIES: hypothetical protein [unclassified Frankia]